MYKKILIYSSNVLPRGEVENRSDETRKSVEWVNYIVESCVVYSYPVGKRARIFRKPDSGI